MIFCLLNCLFLDGISNGTREATMLSMNKIDGVLTLCAQSAGLSEKFCKDGPCSTRISSCHSKMGV